MVIKKILIAVAGMCVMVAGSVSAQKVAPGVKVPVEEDIVPKIFSTGSTFYYPRMMARYMAGDQELTAEHYYYLYFGFAYNDAYDAHRDLPGEVVIREIFEYTRRPTPEQALAIIEAGMENMLVDPFSPGNLNMMTYAYELAGDTLGMRASARRFRGIVEAIESSGTGMRENLPWHILRFSHANDIIAADGLKIANRQVRSRSVEYIQAEKNPQRVKGYFFDYSRVYWKPYEGERVKKKSNWMFNGMPL